MSLTESKVGSLVRSAMCWGCSWGKGKVWSLVRSAMCWGCSWGKGKVWSLVRSAMCWGCSWGKGKVWSLVRSAMCWGCSWGESKVWSLVRSAMCWGCSWGKSVCVRESVWLCPGACGALVMMESRISLLFCSSSGGVGYCLECHLGNTIAYSCMTWRWSKGTSCV